MSNLRIPKAWERIPESQVTPEKHYLNRRDALKQLGVAGAGLAGLIEGTIDPLVARAPQLGPYGHVPAQWAEKWSSLFPAARNEKYRVAKPVTQEKLFAGYNNFYEFSLKKDQVKDLVSSFRVHPWEVEIEGEVEKEGKYDLDDLIRMGELEDRIYRHRCVEAWSAIVPWTGYPLSQLIKALNPSPKAKFVRFVSVYRPSQMPGQLNKTYPWPYYEALTMEEAMNELTLLTFGIYGHPLNKQNGAPIRIIIPWKFGFKGIKSIVKIEFKRKQPRTFWDEFSREYGFYGNINPNFDHPRWSQASEIFLNTRERVPTQLYNGYGEFVSQMYDENDRKYYY